MNVNSELIKLANSQGGRISSKDYVRLLNNKTINSKKPIKKKSKNNTSLKYNSSNKYDFNFILEVEKISNYEYKFILIGKHESTNKANSWLSLGRRMAYKNSIKEAFSNYFLINRTKLIKEPFEKAIMFSVAYNSVSRDDDGNRVTLKTFRDMLKEYNFIIDDSRKYLFEFPNFEVISKEYKMVIYLQYVSTLPTLKDFIEKGFFVNIIC